MEVIVKRYWRSGIALVIPVLLAWGLSACNSRHSAESQSQKDEETRERVADATVKAKEDARIAERQLAESARQAEHDAKITAQGVKEGWDRDKDGRLDLNSASRADLRSVGLSEPEADRVIDGRPYKDKQELVTRGILPQADFANVQDRVTVISPSESSQR